MKRKNEIVIDFIWRPIWFLLEVVGMIILSSFLSYVLWRLRFINALPEQIFIGIAIMRLWFLLKLTDPFRS